MSSKIHLILINGKSGDGAENFGCFLTAQQVGCGRVVRFS